MLLTAPLLSKSSFFGSMFNKIRQVKNNILPTKKSINPNSKNNKNNQNFTPSSLCTSPTNPSATITTTTTIPTTNKTTSTTNAVPSVVASTNQNFNINNNNTRSTAVANISLSSTAAVQGKTIEEKLGLPPRPKKPLTPYFRYMKDLRPKVSAECPKLNNLDQVKHISKLWEKADPNLKQKLQEEYKRDQLKYIEQRTKYDAKVTDEQRAEIKQMKKDVAEAKERKMMRKRVRELGKPKKPSSAYLRFIIAERKATTNLTKDGYREWHQKVTEKWGRLSDAEKETYLKDARKDMVVYKEELQKWEEKMIQMGNIDVVRHINLIDPPEPKPKKQQQIKQQH